MASSHDGLRVSVASIGNPSTQAPFKHVLVSGFFVMSYWLKQVTWPSQDSESRGMHFISCWEELQNIVASFFTLSQ